MMEVAPKISVIIPTKNRSTLLPRAVASVLKAERLDIEICIVDDHSTPPAIAGLGAFRDDPRLRILIQDAGRTGVSAARNLGLCNARGALLFFLDDDDTIAPGYIEKVEGLDHGAFAYGCAAYERDDFIQAKCVERRFDEGPIPRDAPLRKQLFGLGMGFWMTRACYETIGALDEDLSINEDTDYFCRLLQAQMAGWYSADVGVTVSVHATQTDLQNITNRSNPLERARCMRVLANRYPDMRSHLGGKYIDHLLKAGMTGEALSYIRADRSLFMKAKFTARLVIKSAAYRLKSLKRGLRGTVSNASDYNSN